MLRNRPPKAIAFGGRFRNIEREWRDYLRRLRERRLELEDGIPALDLSDELTPDSPL